MKMKNDGTGKWYVSLYELYPIYEPAEGGYYYNGVQLADSYEFKTRKGAMRKLTKIERSIMRDSDTLNQYPLRWNGFKRENTPDWSNDHTWFGVTSQYVGEGFFWQLERTQGMSESGRQSYC